MLKGTYTTSTGQAYTVFYGKIGMSSRIDICVLGATFNIDFDKIIFSKAVDTKERQFGDNNIYLDYCNVINTVNQYIEDLKPEFTTDSDFNILQQRIFENELIEYKEVLRNSELIELVYKIKDGARIELRKFLDSDKMLLVPSNINRYQTVESILKVINKTDVPYLNAKELKAIYNLKHLESKKMVYVDDDIIIQNSTKRNISWA